SSIIRNRTVLQLRSGPAVGLWLVCLRLQQFLVNLDTQARTARQADVAIAVQLPLHPGNPLRIEALIVRVELVDQEERNRGDNMEAGRDAKVAGGAVRGQRNVVGLGQKGDLLHLADAARVAAVRLQDVETAIVEVSNHLPDGAV